jgi:hypothetical protein
VKQKIRKKERKQIALIVLVFVFIVIMAKWTNAEADPSQVPCYGACAESRDARAATLTEDTWKQHDPRTIVALGRCGYPVGQVHIAVPRVLDMYFDQDVHWNDVLFVINMVNSDYMELRHCLNDMQSKYWRHR